MNSREQTPDRYDVLAREVARQRRLAERLCSLTTRLTGDLEHDTLLRQIAAEVLAVGYAGCSLMLFGTEADGSRALSRLFNTFEAEEDCPRLRYSADLPEVAALLEGNPHRLDAPEVYAGFDAVMRAFLRKRAIVSMLRLPIRYKGETLGALTVWASETAWGQHLVGEAFISEADSDSESAPDPFCDAATTYLAALAVHAAVTLGHAALMNEMRAEHEAVIAQAAQLREANQKLLTVQTELEAQYLALEASKNAFASLATTDDMTGLANHRAFQVELSRQVARAQRANTPLSLLLLDVDKFKQYNDTYGHPAGDAVLKKVGSLLQKSVREGDLPARYGGEEFAVILPDTDEETAAMVAERIRVAVESTKFPNRAVTVSIGVTHRLPSEAQDALVQRADVALYEAKSAGRNCIARVSGEAMETHEAADLLENAAPHGEELRAEDIDALAEEIGMQDHAAFSLSALPKEVSEAGRVSSLMPSPVSGMSQVAHFADGGLEGLLQEPTMLLLSELMEALDKHGAEPRGHSERVARYALRVGLELAEYYDEQRATRSLLPRLNASDLLDLAYGALLHDIGKVGIPEAILRKTGQLTDDEWRQIRRHPLAGAELISGQPLLERALPVVRCHHERWDGIGYPQGLSHEAIPLSARIFAVCDVLDVLTTDKPYRARLDYAAACEEISHSAGTQFDPDVVAAFLRIPEADWHYLSSPPARAFVDPPSVPLSRAA